jgi:hypothetical protein
MIRLTEEQTVKLQQIAIKKRLEASIARHIVHSWENDLYQVYELCCEISGKPCLTTRDIPIILLGEQEAASMQAWAINRYDFWDILCTVCTMMPDETVATAVQKAISEMTMIYTERSKSCGWKEGMDIGDLSLKQAIELTALGAIRWDHRLNNGQGDSVYSPLYTRGWGLAHSPIAVALRR